MGGRVAPRHTSPPAYNEETFQYFLDLERKRSTCSKRPVLLMLIELKRGPGINPQVMRVAAAKLLALLSSCLRETDFIGWYREGHTLGAVLPQHTETDRGDLPDIVRQRVGDALGRWLPADLTRYFEVRVCQLSPKFPVR
jgi:hypothetical protein